jgi:hypothetical protein
MFRVSQERFVYTDELRRVGECQVDVFLHNERFLVVFTELNGNPGPSVTNAAEHIIDQYCRQNGLSFEEADFFERYEAHPDDLDEIILGDHKRRTVCQCPQVHWRRLPVEQAKPILEALAASESTTRRRTRSR